MSAPANRTEARSIPLLPSGTEGVVHSAMSAARLAQACWSARPLRARLERIRELRHLISEHALFLAEASASTRLRPARESITAEVLPLADACRFLEREAPSILAPRRLGRRNLPFWLSGVRTEVHREPFGVIAIIGPGNYPLLLPGVQMVQALAAGNAVLLKPGAGGSWAARALVELMARAGFDSNLIAVLPESTEAALAAIDAGPDKVVFTGAAATGEKILALLAPRLTPATMELSGCDAFIVRADADLDLVVKALKFGLELNHGATCMAPKRVLVHRAIATALEARLAQTFALQHSRNQPSQTRADVTEMSSAAAKAWIRLVTGAVAQGARFVTGGVSPDGTLQFPIILAGVQPRMRLLHEDVFAPVCSLLTVSDDAEAVARANDCPYALGASVFSNDETAARAVAYALHAGIVSINDLIVPSADPRVPFGGRKRSGFGVTRGLEGLLEMTAPKVVSVSRARFRPAFQLPRPRDEEMFQSCLQLTHGRGLGRRARALASLFTSLALRNKPATKPST